MADPQVDVIAHQTGAAFRAPTDNPALQLADALQGVNQNLKPALMGFAKDEQAKQATRAHADAMANSGAAFSDAVKSGKILPTQNPWYIKAYETDAATVRAQGEVSQLVQDSQSFASRNSAPDFEKEFTGKLGEIAKKYADPDQAAGFNAAAQPLLQQTIQQNVQQNVQRIQQEHNQNISTLATSAILAAKAANGGHPTPGQVFDAIEPQHQQWLSTGGTEAAWNNLTINSVIAAGYNSGDSTLLSVLDDPRGGKGPLSNIAGPDGKPVAETLSTARHYIDQIASEQGMGEIRSKQNAVKLEGLKASSLITDHFGYDFLNGKVSKADVLTFLQDQGVSAAGAQYAVGELAKAANDSASLSRSLMGGDPEVLQLYGQASREGYTPELQSRVAEKVRKGEMDLTEAEQVLSTAQSRANHLESESRSDARQAKSDARAAASDQRRLTTDQAKALKDHRTQRLGVVSTALSGVGIKSLADPKARAAFASQLQDVEGNYLAFHPGDTMGASKAVDDAANSYLNGVIARRRKPAAGSSPSAGNPRR